MNDLQFSCAAPHTYSPYSLDLSNPVDAAILHEVCGVACRNPLCEISGVELSRLNGAGKKVDTHKMQLQYAKTVCAHDSCMICWQSLVYLLHCV